MKQLVLLVILSTLLFSSSKENIIKGVILERISQFIDYKNDNNEFNICVYKDEDLVKSFKGLYKNRKYKGSSIKVMDISSINELKGCNIFYAKGSDNSMMKKVIAREQKHTLLVTENISYLDDGFMIVLYFEQHKLKFDINQASILDANLSVNFRLLEVASRVIRGGEE